MPGGDAAVEPSGFKQAVDHVGHAGDFRIHRHQERIPLGQLLGFGHEEEFGDAAQAGQGRSQFVGDDAENLFHGGD